MRNLHSATSLAAADGKGEGEMARSCASRQRRSTPRPARAWGLASVPAVKLQREVRGLLQPLALEAADYPG